MTEYKCGPPRLADDKKLEKKHWLKCPKAVPKKNQVWTKI